MADDGGRFDVVERLEAQASGPHPHNMVFLLGEAVDEIMRLRHLASEVGTQLLNEREARSRPPLGLKLDGA